MDAVNLSLFHHIGWIDGCCKFVIVPPHRMDRWMLSVLSLFHHMGWMVCAVMCWSSSPPSAKDKYAALNFST